MGFFKFGRSKVNGGAFTRAIKQFINEHPNMSFGIPHTQIEFVEGLTLNNSFHGVTMKHGNMGVTFYLAIHSNGSVNTTGVSKVGFFCGNTEVFYYADPNYGIIINNLESVARSLSGVIVKFFGDWLWEGWASDINAAGAHADRICQNFNVSQLSRILYIKGRVQQ